MKWAFLRPIGTLDLATHLEHPAAQATKTLPLRDELRVAIDTIPGLVWTALPAGDIDFLNQRWLDYTGLSLDVARGWGWQVAIHPDDLPGLTEYWRSVLAAGIPGETEARLRRHDGEYRWFLFRGVPLYDEHGVLLKWYGQTTDIEDRKRAETLLQNEKRLLEMVARGDPLEAIFRDLCIFVECSTPGTSCAILLLDSEADRLRPLAAPTIPEAYLHAAHGRSVSSCAGPCGKAAHLNEQVIVADIAAEIPWDEQGWRSMVLGFGFRACWSTPIRSSTGGVLGTFAIYGHKAAAPTVEQRSLIEQFTALASVAIERDERQSKLLRSEAHLAEAQRLSLTGSYTWRSNGDIYWSDETYRIFELEPHVKPTLELARSRIHPDDRAIFDWTAAHAWERCADFTFEHRLLLPHGDVKYLHVVAHAVKGRDGQLAEYTGAVRDVTELRVREAALHRVRAELAHVSRASAVGQLTASIAHEVNQPLSGILTNASVCVRLLTAREPDIGGAIEAARRTTRDANRAAEVIARLRALFRKKGLAREPFNLNEAVAEVIALATNEVERSKASVRADLAAETPIVKGDRTQIQQVVLNLALNALEAMNGVDAAKRELTFQTSFEGSSEVAVTVRDTGAGIATVDVERIFDPFFTTKEGGMGMGLSISRSIIENHEGKLGAFPNDGGGAAFRFILPRVVAA